MLNAHLLDNESPPDPGVGEVGGVRGVEKRQHQNLAPPAAPKPPFLSVHIRDVRVIPKPTTTTKRTLASAGCDLEQITPICAEWAQPAPRVGGGHCQGSTLRPFPGAALGTAPEPASPSAARLAFD